MRQMRPTAADIARSMVVVSVCVRLCVCACVGHTDVLCKNGWTDRDTVWRADLCGPRELCIRWGSRSDSGESIHSCNRWQVDDVAYCQITLDTGYY